MSGKILFVLVLLFTAGGGYYYYDQIYLPGQAAKSAPAPDMSKMVMPVSVATVSARDVQQWNEYSGRLTAVDFVEVRSRVSGPVETVDFKDGAIVQKGDLLFTIDPRPYAAEVARTQAALAQAKAARDLSGTRFKRAANLIKDKAIAQSDFDTRKNELDVAKAQVESAQASLDTAKLNLDYTRIASPITGRVSRAELTIGNLVDAGQSSPLLTTVVSQTPLYADFDIDEATYLKLAPEIAGDASKIAVTLQLASGGALHQGVMQSFDNRLNPQSGTLRARAVFNNDDGTLVPGLFARVRVGSASMTKAVLITDRAVGTDQSKKFVYVVGAGNKVEYREVKLGDTSGNLRIVTEGLKADEKIIVSGLQRAHPGAEVKPEMVDMEAPETGPEAAVPASGPEKETAKDKPADAPKADTPNTNAPKPADAAKSDAADVPKDSPASEEKK